MSRLGRKMILRGLAGSMLVGALVLPAPVAAGGSDDCTASCVTAFAMPAGGSPFGVTKGPHGDEWISLNTRLGRIDRTGTLTTVDIPTPDAAIGWLTAGPGGVIWFAERGTGKLGRLSANGSIREYQLPGGPDAIPQGIVVGPDHKVWIADQFANEIVRLDPRTGAIVEYPVPGDPLGLVLGRDGALWFTERSAAKIGRLTLDGAYTEWPLADGAFPNRIVVGPDGQIWFTELFGGKVARITYSGVLTEYPVDGGPVGITVGKDHQIYTVLFLSHQVARLDSNGEVTGTWDLLGAAGPLQIATGRGRDLWITDAFGNLTFRFTPYNVGH
jgi:virginiamycin B lyase